MLKLYNIPISQMCSCLVVISVLTTTIKFRVLYSNYYFCIVVQYYAQFVVVLNNYIICKISENTPSDFR